MCVNIVWEIGGVGARALGNKSTRHMQPLSWLCAIRTINTATVCGTPPLSSPVPFATVEKSLDCSKCSTARKFRTVEVLEPDQASKCKLLPMEISVRAKMPLADVR